MISLFHNILCLEVFHFNLKLKKQLLFYTHYFHGKFSPPIYFQSVSLYSKCISFKKLQREEHCQIHSTSSPLLKPEKDNTKKENYRPKSLMTIDAKPSIKHQHSEFNRIHKNQILAIFQGKL